MNDATWLPRLVVVAIYLATCAWLLRLPSSLTPDEGGRAGRATRWGAAAILAVQAAIYWWWG